jgi:methionyl-tRNA formyltransferase
MEKMSNIVFFGTESYSLIVLKALIEHGYSVSAVVTKPDAPKGRGHTMRSPAVKTYALSQNIHVLQPQRVSDITQFVTTLDHPVGVLAAYGRVVPPDVLALFTPGIVNIHPSLLPHYRGPSPVEAAIAHRDAKTGVSIMQLESTMDAGPIYMQVPYALDHTETKQELYDTLFQLGANLLIQHLPAITAGSLVPTPQDNHQATYCPLLTKKDGILDPATVTPGEAEARIRAHLGYPRTHLTVGSYDIVITKAHAVMTKQHDLDIKCKNDAYLSIDELIAPSGKHMTSAEFLRGYRL